MAFALAFVLAMICFKPIFIFVCRTYFSAFSIFSISLSSVTPNT